MTGTASTEANEFAEIYKLDVVEIPTNRPVCRLDEDDEVYRTAKEKLGAIAAEIEAANANMQPLLVGTTSIEKSEQLAEFLLTQGYTQIDFADPKGAAPSFTRRRAPASRRSCSRCSTRASTNRKPISSRKPACPARSPSPPIWPAAAPTFSLAATSRCA